jgi:pimeloyl-ACP methyl ester carboxylesterase
MSRPPFPPSFVFRRGLYCVTGSQPVERPSLSTVLAMQTETRYADSGGVNIAYQTMGEGPQDLVLVHGWASNIEIYQEEPAFARFVARLASFTRLILFDKRGTGLSDRVSDMPSLEVRMDDVRAVMDAVGSERAALFGVSEGGTMCALFSATYPQRTTALIMCGSFPRRIRAADYPFGLTKEEMQLRIAKMQREWGGPVGLAERAPSMVGDIRFSQWWGRMLRMAVSPAGIGALMAMNNEIDIRHILPAIRVATLLLHSPQDLAIEFGVSRYMAERIPGARLVELPGPATAQISMSAPRRISCSGG